MDPSGFTLTIKLTLFVGYTVQCICYQSLGLVAGVSIVPELTLLYNVSLEALKSYAFAKSLGLVS